MRMWYLSPPPVVHFFTFGPMGSDFARSRRPHGLLHIRAGRNIILKYAKSSKTAILSGPGRLAERGVGSCSILIRGALEFSAGFRNWNKMRGCHSQGSCEKCRVEARLFVQQRCTTTGFRSLKSVTTADAYWMEGMGAAV